MLSHRARLTVTTSIASGLLLAIVFIGAIWFFRSQALTATRLNLDDALELLTADIKANASPDLIEAHQAYPSASFSTYDANGKRLARAGPLSAYPLVGLRIERREGLTMVSEGKWVQPYTLVGSVDWSENEAALGRLTWTLVLLWVLMVAIVASVTWYAATFTFKPLQELTEQATRLSGEDLALRLDSRDKAEFGVFAKHLNALLERVEITARREEQFASDAAHELRNPLAVLLGTVDTALLRDRPAGDYKEALDAMLPELLKMTRLIEALLRSARAPYEAPPATDISEVLSATAERWKPLYDAQKVGLRVELEPVTALIFPEEMECVLDNLLENALRHSSQDSECSVSLAAKDGRGVVTVSDQGSGVPEDRIEAIFDRFSKGHPDYPAHEGQFGIGLAICRNIVNSREGEIRARNLNPGLEFRFELPVFGG
jgi:two-component system heavy metal sensor histidine kinase CusS